MTTSTDTQSSSTQTNAPPSWSAPGWNLAGNDLINLYKSGKGGNAWTKKGYVPYSDQTWGGIGALNKLGLQGSWDTAGTRDMYEGFATGDNPWMADLRGVADYLTPIAEGQYLEEGNPYYKERLTNDINDTMDLMKSSLSGQGRYGSDYAASSLSDTAGDMMLAGLENDWNRERGYQQQSFDQLANIFGQGAQTQLYGIDAMSNLDQRNFQNQGVGALAQLQAGQMIDQNAQARLDDKIRRFHAKDNQDWQRMAMFIQGLSGVSGNYGTQTGSMTGSSQTTDPLGAIGGILGSIPTGGGTGLLGKG